MIATAWGPFTPNIDWPERKARLRSLRALVKVYLGPRGFPVAMAILRAEISGGDLDLLQEAAAEFDRLAPLDRRRVLGSFQGLLPPHSDELPQSGPAARSAAQGRPTGIR